MIIGQPFHIKGKNDNFPKEPSDKEAFRTEVAAAIKLFFKPQLVPFD